MKPFNCMQTHELWLVENNIYLQTICLQIMYLVLNIYKQNLPSNNPQELICHNTQQTKSNADISAMDGLTWMFQLQMNSNWTFQFCYDFESLLR